MIASTSSFGDSRNNVAGVRHASRIGARIQLVMWVTAMSPRVEKKAMLASGGGGLLGGVPMQDVFRSIEPGVGRGMGAHTSTCESTPTGFGVGWGRLVTAILRHSPAAMMKFDTCGLSPR